MVNRQSTETALKDWRYGQTQAERLAAAILLTERYDNVDPQSPLGGPDGIKDILCSKGGISWIAACYFPTTGATIGAIKKKLRGDAKGIVKNKASGIVFFVNQHVSPTERADLAKIVKPKKLELFHMERMRAILDSPQGYGIRLEYLRIEMTQEEQLAFWSYHKEGMADEMRSVHNKLDILMMRTTAIDTNLQALPSALRATQAEDATLPPTATLTEEHVFWLHRTLLSDYPNFRDGLRNVVVWIGGGAGVNKAAFVPIPPAQVPKRFSTMLTQWRKRYPTLIRAEREEIIKTISHFHYEFLSIHPFLDGNGRVSRSILQQQIKELLGQDIHAIFSDDPAGYYRCLKKANDGDIDDLTALITASLE